MIERKYMKKIFIDQKWTHCRARIPAFSLNLQEGEKEKKENEIKDGVNIGVR